MSTVRRQPGSAHDISGQRLHTPAALRNRDPILRVLRRLIEADRTVLEIGSGTGVHIAYFARHMPQVRWRPSDPNGAMRASIAAWCADLPGADNPVDPPLALDMLANDWWHQVPPPVDAVLSINMLHVAPPEAVTGLTAGCGRLLAPGGLLMLYGPFRFNGQCCGVGNERFDTMLRQQNAAWGLRDLNDIAAQGAIAGLGLERVVDMPAGNHMVLLRRR